MTMNVKELVKKYGIRMTKSLGQNFLTDERIVEQIAGAAELGTEDLVIEVGPGIGDMTKVIAQKAGRVVAVEIDRRLIPALQENLKECSNVMVLNRDIMALDAREILEERIPGLNKIKVVANLPYYITTPVIMRFLEDFSGIDTMVFMVQREVADRMAAAPGGKDYGALSVAVQYYSKPEKLFEVPPHCFIPQPEVYSTVIRLKVHQEPIVELISREAFFQTVKAAFGQRRKTLLNALSNAGCFGKSKEEISEILSRLGIDQNRRGETLSITQFAELSNTFAMKTSGSKADCEEKS